MIVSMQGNWTVTVKSKHAAFPQRFVVAGAATGNGAHAGTPGTSVSVTGDQWTIAIQHDPGTGFQLSATKLQYPHKVGTQYLFDITSNDAGGDEDFNDLVLTCSTPASINDFIVYGKVQMYSGNCLFNPCRRPLLVIETADALQRAIRNARLREILEHLYPERIPPKLPPEPGPFPDPPGPEPFKPMMIDLFGEMQKANTLRVYRRDARVDATAAASKSATPKSAAKRSADAKTTTKSKATESLSSARTDFGEQHFSLVEETAKRSITAERPDMLAAADIGRIVDQLYPLRCRVEAAVGITLTFEEYDRTTAELAGGAYTGTGHRRLLGDTITDMNGNYIFRFSFDMTFPGLEETTDVAPGEDISVVAYPDLIAKVTAYAPSNVLYESAPHFNIGNLKRLDLCLPKSMIVPTSVCFNGSLIGSLGNVFIGGNQNSAASFSTAALRRHGYSNYLEPNGVVTVRNSQAGFTAECAAWTGLIDMKGCMYDVVRPPSENRIKHYTIRIRRAGTTRWEYVSQNYKHPRYHKRNLPNYTGDDVGPFATSLHVDGGPAEIVPAYRNIQREMFVDGLDWEFSNIDRYMQLNSRLYDVLNGERTPGTFYVRVDGYDASGHHVTNATDMIALFIHNLPLQFQLDAATLLDPAIVSGGCGLHRLTDAQLNTVMELPFKTNDPYGFVDSYTLAVHRCPSPMIALDMLQPPSLPDTSAGDTLLAAGDAALNLQTSGCPGYTGTLQDFSSSGMIAVQFKPALSEGGWIKSGEYYTVYDFSLKARLRITNGYNRGVSDLYEAYRRIAMERLTT